MTLDWVTWTWAWTKCLWLTSHCSSSLLPSSTMISPDSGLFMISTFGGAAIKMRLRHRDNVWGDVDMFVFSALTGAQGVALSVSMSATNLSWTFYLHLSSGSFQGHFKSIKRTFCSESKILCLVLLTPPLISMLNVCSMGGLEATWQVSWPASSLLTSVTVSVLLAPAIWTE